MSKPLFLALALTLGLIVASGALSARNLHAYWGSWEPLRRAARPNPLRPALYLPRHNRLGQWRNPNRESAADLLTRLYHERAWRVALADGVRPLTQTHRTMLQLGITGN